MVYGALTGAGAGAAIGAAFLLLLQKVAESVLQQGLYLVVPMVQLLVSFKVLLLVNKTGRFG